MAFLDFLLLNKNWNELARLLAGAAAYLPDTAKSREALALFNEYLEQNELELAMQTLADVANEAEIEKQSIIWNSLSLAAGKMKLAADQKYYDEQHWNAQVERARRFQISSSELKVELRFLTTAEGGRKGPALSGYRPTFLYQEQYSSTCLQFIGQPVCLPGDTVQAYMVFLAPEAQKGRLHEGAHFKMTEGASVVAQGIVVQVLDETMCVARPSS